VGILGAGVLSGPLEEVLNGKQLDGHPYQVRLFDRPEDVRDCQVLFVNLPEPRRTGALGLLPEGGILTIGEGESFTRHGGVIALVEEDAHLKFDLNLKSADRAGLQMSATLLRLARNVGRW